MTFIIGLLTFVLVLVCVALIFLVLLQLPKKEAGVGIAFGGAAADALFGAGSGNVLTKATKYFATTFFLLAIVVGVMQSHINARSKVTEFQRAVDQQQQQAPVAPQAPAKPAPVSAPVQK
jgi:preprotein translocase subunit SecG